MSNPLTEAEQRAALAEVARRRQELQPRLGQALGEVVPILRVDIRPTPVDPAAPGGVQNMKRVLSAILASDNNKVTVKDERGHDIGMRNFNEIYPQVVGPDARGAIQLEYCEQATLGWFGDLLWSMGWFTRNGLLGVPRQMIDAALQAMGVRFVMETYYQNWLASILDEFSQRGLVPGYCDAKTGANHWLIETPTIGRNIIVRPAVPHAPVAPVNSPAP